ncbi:MAG: hypothetical protein RLZZ126_1894 [Pseudomonadota bacterium]|jgi:hypothetical protein
MCMRGFYEARKRQARVFRNTISFCINSIHGIGVDNGAGVGRVIAHHGLVDQMVWQVSGYVLYK